MDPAETEPGPGDRSEKPADGAAPPRNPLPDPGDAPMAPPDERYPLRGKMASHTAAPSPSARLENLQQKARAGRRKKFLIALLAGQVFILLLDLGGEALLHVLRNKFRYGGALPLRAMVFIGMTSTIAALGVLLFAVLGFKGAKYVLGEKKVGFFTALGIGIRRVWNEAWALGLILGVIGGTAWFLIPAAGRDDLKARGLRYVEQGKGWVEKRIDTLKPDPAPPANKR